MTIRIIWGGKDTIEGDGTICTTKEISDIDEKQYVLYPYSLADRYIISDRFLDKNILRQIVKEKKRKGIDRHGQILTDIQIDIDIYEQVEIDREIDRYRNSPAIMRLQP